MSAFAYWNGSQTIFDSAFFKQWSNAVPDFKVFSKSEVAEVLRIHASEYVELFLDLAIPASQSDICRFVMAYELGGLYTDCHFGFEDAGALRSFMQDCPSHGVVAVENRLFRDIRPADHPLLISGFMFAQRRHPLMLDALFLACENLARHRHREATEGHVEYDIWKLCGPWVLNVAAFENVEQDAPDPRFTSWPKDSYPVLKSKYSETIKIVREEDLPVQRNMFKNFYQNPGTHWSERQISENLFRSTTLC